MPDPERFGVAEFDAAGRVVGFEEKPAVPKSDLIPIGVYFLRPDAFDVIEGLLPSGRGEFEITDVLNHYVRGRPVLLAALRRPVVRRGHRRVAPPRVDGRQPRRGRRAPRRRRRWPTGAARGRPAGETGAACSCS